MENKATYSMTKSVEHITNYSFVPLSYKLGLVRTLVDRVFEINNTWFGFHNNIKELTNILGKNMFPLRIVDKGKPFNNSFQFLSTLPPLSAAAKHRAIIITYHFFGPFANTVQHKIKRLTQRFCKCFDIKLVFPL